MKRLTHHFSEVGHRAQNRGTKISEILLTPAARTKLFRPFVVLNRNPKKGGFMMVLWWFYMIQDVLNINMVSRHGGTICRKQFNTNMLWKKMHPSPFQFWHLNQDIKTILWHATEWHPLIKFGWSVGLPERFESQVCS